METVCCIRRRVSWLLIAAPRGKARSISITCPTGSSEQTHALATIATASKDHTCLSHYAQLILDGTDLSPHSDAAGGQRFMVVALERILQLMPGNTNEKMGDDAGGCALPEVEEALHGERRNA